ncbi:hypothetical protein [Fischerella sp. PCC 9605]|uniref:hypothetical protein n=1 Tax=Fischerella sp. PCC 9605 TaxID=1173024 RepID=UPI00047927A7|nr:hypothetical protein [Fischerella sp. PCC 9605]
MHLDQYIQSRGVTFGAVVKQIEDRGWEVIDDELSDEQVITLDTHFNNSNSGIQKAPEQPKYSLAGIPREVLEAELKSRSRSELENEILEHLSYTEQAYSWRDELTRQIRQKHEEELSSWFQEQSYPKSQEEIEIHTKFVNKLAEYGILVEPQGTTVVP